MEAEKGESDAPKETRSHTVPSSLLCDFADETGIFGLHLLGHTNALESAFWVLVVIGTCTYTLKDLTILTQSYMNEDSNTLAQLVMNTSFMLDPSPTFVLTWPTALFEHRATAPNLTDVDLKLDAFVHDYETWKANKSVELHMDVEIVELNFALIGTIGATEMSMVADTKDLEQPTLVHTYRLFKRYLAADHDVGVALEQAAAQAYHKYAAANVDFAELTSLTASSLCKLYALKIVSHRFRKNAIFENVENISVCKHENIVNLNIFQLTLRPFGDKPFTVQNGRDFFTVITKQLRADTLPWNVTGAPAVQFFPHGLPVSDPFFEDKERYTEFKAGVPVEVHFRLSSVFQRLSKREKPCSPRWQSEYDCTRRCRASYILQRCGCWPIYYTPYFRPEKSGAPICPGHRVGALNASGEAFLIPTVSECVPLKQAYTEECETQCLPDCELRQFLFSTMNLPLAVGRPDTVFAMVFVSSFSYQLFAEQLKMETNEFLSQFGGALGLWLGISFGSLLHIPIFFLRWVAQKVFRSRHAYGVNDALAMK